MPRADEGGGWLPQGRDQLLLEGNALVPGRDGRPYANQAVAIANRRGNVRHLIAARLPLFDAAPEPLERVQEECFDVVGLEAPRFCTLHLLPYSVHPARVRRVVSQRPLFDEILEVSPIDGPCHDFLEARPDIGLLTVTDRLDQQLAQRLAFELRLAEDVEDLAAERLPRLFQLVQ